MASEKRLTVSEITFFSLCTLFIVLVYLKSYNYLPQTDLLNGGGYAFLTNLSTNAFHIWTPKREHLFPILHIVITAISTFIFLSTRTRPINAFFAALLFPALILLIFGADHVVLQSIAITPLWILAAQLFFTSSSLVSFLAFTVISISVALTSNQLSPLIIVFGGLFAWGLDGKLKIDVGYRNFTYLILLALVPAAIKIYYIPIVPIEKYPANSHLVEEDGVLGISQPLIAQGSDIQIIDRLYIHSTYSSIALLLLIFTILSYLFVNKKAGKVTLLLSIIIFIDIYLSPKASLIGPVQALSRIVPTWFFIPITPVLIALNILILLCTFAIESNRRLVSKLLTLSLLFSLYLITGLNPGFVVTDTADLFVRVVNKTKNPETRQHDLHTLIFSPSAKALSEITIDTVLRLRELSSYRFRPLKGANIEITSADKNLEKLRNIIDGDLNTRWSPENGKQQGDEWIKVRFPISKKISAIELATGSFYTDFPRGIRVDYLQNCSTIDDNADPINIINIPKWRGSPALLNNILPFYRPLSKVKIYFPKDVDAQCLLIKQTGKENNYDWSIAELKIMWGRD